MNTEITENLFQSIDTIISARIANLSYDKTIECEVVGFEDEYFKVQYQAAIFKASSLVKNLSVGDIVYVTVPQGDFKQDKIIIAKKIKSDINVVKTLPFLSFVKSANLFGTNQSTREYSIAVNSGTSAMSTNHFVFTTFFGQDVIAGYTRLGIKTTVNSEITTNLISGDYGIKVTIYGYNQNTTHLPAADALELARRNYTKFEYYLKKEDMISTNVYNTHGYQNQEKVIDISNLVIDSITIDLWQDNNFRDIYDNLIESQRIYFSNLQLYLGYDLSEFETNNTRLFIYTYDGLLYNSSNVKYYTKEIYSRIITKTVDNFYTDSSNLYGSKWNYFWEYYDPSSTSTSMLSLKKGYELIPFDANTTYRQLTGSLARQLSTSNTQTRNGFIFILRNPAALKKHNYISNELIFKNEAYNGSGEEEADESTLSSYFTIDNNGYVYLGSSASNNAKPLTIENIILKGELTVLGDDLLFTTEDGRTVLLKLDKNGKGEFLGTATSAQNFDLNTGLILKNFRAIAQAINNHTNYTIVTT